jgi:L-fuculose-phosphate aldolase
MLITPADLPEKGMTAADIVFVHPSGRADGHHRPASDWRLHHAIYDERPDVHAIARVQTPAATALATLRQDLPAIHHVLFDAAGGDIRCASFAPPDSGELAASALTALDGRSACLLANNALLVCASSPSEAMRRVAEIEAVCDLYLRARAIGDPETLSPSQASQPLELVDLRAGRDSALGYVRSDGGQS